MSVLEASASQDVEGVTAKILRKISAEPVYRVVLYKILALCETVRSSTEIDQAVRSFPEMKTALQSPQVLLSWLVQEGGIEQVAAKEAADKEQDPMWCTTQPGRAVVENESPANRLVRLLAQEPIYHDIYLQVLRACISPKSKAEVESILRGNPVLETPKVYASFFLEGLEAAEGIEWNSKWCTTNAGKMFVS